MSDAKVKHFLEIRLINDIFLLLDGNHGDFEVSQKIQKMVFPNGVIWDKENRAYLTDFGNLFFDLISSVSRIYKNEAAQKKDESCDLSRLVAEGGLEPPTFGL